MKFKISNSYFLVDCENFRIRNIIFKKGVRNQKRKYIISI